jgi:hypothetical protein
MAHRLPIDNLANWWIVRASDGRCVVVDIEPTRKDKSVTKVGKDAYQNRIRPKPTSNAFAKNLNPQFSLRGSQETPSEILNVHFGSFADVTKRAFVR